MIPIDAAVMLTARRQSLWRYFRSAWVQFSIGAVFLIATNLMALRIPRQVGRSIGHLRDAKTLADIDVALVEGFAWTIAGLALGAACARIFSRIFVFNAARRIEYDLRNELFAHLTRLDLPFFQRSATGDLVSRITNDVTYIRLLYGISVLHAVNTTVAYIIVLGLMTSVSSKLTLYALAPYPLFLLTIGWFTQAIYKRTQAAQETLSDVSARAQENLAGVSVIKAFNSQEREKAAFRKVSDQYLERNLALARVRGALNPYMASIGGVGTLLVLWLGGQEVIDGTLTLGQYVEFSGYIVALAFPTIAMGWVVSVWNRGVAAMDRLLHILHAQPNVTQDPDAAPINPDKPLGDLVFEDVTLTYEDGTVALEDINLTIPQGARVAIVGRTGSGKSTLVHLIPRLRDPTKGRITLGGKPLQKLELVGLRSQIGYVPQDPFLFSMSIKDNVRLGQHGGSDTGPGLKKALQIAHIGHDLEAMPQGLQTMVGERGITLSGGQKQRLTIARAVLLDPRLLILDDALASVDAATERQIITELDRIMEGRTSILVTHRYNALELVDEIVVLDQGRIVEQGSHDALLKARGLYHRLYEKQINEAKESSR